jgi:serine/threonine protein kinase
MASVWLGDDEVLDRPVAIKVLFDTIASDPDFRARFRREATVAAGLSHPNLVGVYDYSEDDERPYLVMEFVPGDDLGTLIEREAGVDRDRLARELLGAVAHIHAAGIVHRDVKPHNIVVEPTGSAKLIDFGIAVPRDATSLTQTGLVLATRRYAAPEVMEGRPATERSDLYSCGVVLRACPGRGSAALETLVTRLTDADPRARPHSARQALEDLEHQTDRGQPTEAFSPALAGEPSREPPRRGPPDDGTLRLYSPSASARKRWGAAAAILGVAAALVVAVLAAGNSGGNGGTTPTQASAGKNASAGNEAGGRAQPNPAEPTPTEAAAPAEETPPAPSPASNGSDPALGSALNEEGFALIQQGRYEEAVPLLEQAVAAFPPGTEDIDYAYALFNLGDALRRSGRADEAVPVLEQRLEIPDQTDVVLQELETARAESAGSSEGGLPAQRDGGD